WQHDLWLEIIQASLDDRQPDCSQLHGFDQPAVSRYGSTSPELLRWFKKYNEGKLYHAQVKPFNFLLSLQARHDCKELKPASPYVKDIDEASAQCFDRVTGEHIVKDKLKIYQESLAQYHLHPETKFLNGDYLDQGKTERRHVVVQSIQYIGKEANKLEEQVFIGVDSNAQVMYGSSKESLDTILQSIDKYGIKRMAVTAKISVRHVHNIYHRKTIAKEKTLAKLLFAVIILNNTSDSKMSENANNQQSVQTKTAPVGATFD
ncbi:MAG: hypothetical protein QNL62_02180, partial [Gammaproteobacteria bacterium]|nr:hypothetical protein [Gammaproteobacteria bacterium]